MRFALFILLFPVMAIAQDLLPITAYWDAVTENENNEPVDSGDLTYAVMDGIVLQEMCATTSTQCTFYVGPGECGSLYAVARQVSTGLESMPSNVVDVCVDYRLTAPVLRVAL